MIRYAPYDSNLCARAHPHVYTSLLPASIVVYMPWSITSSHSTRNTKRIVARAVIWTALLPEVVTKHAGGLGFFFKPFELCQQKQTKKISCENPATKINILLKAGNTVYCCNDCGTRGRRGRQGTRRNQCEYTAGFLKLQFHGICQKNTKNFRGKLRMTNWRWCTFRWLTWR